MIVYGSSLSPFVRKVLAFTAEKGIAVEVQPVGPGSEDPGFREASPFGKMPALRDGDFTLADSSAIVAYLEALQPEPELIPAEPRARGRVIWWEEFGDALLGQCMRTMFGNRIVMPRFKGIVGDDAAAARAEAEELPPLLDHLERALDEAGEYLVGGRLTLADIAVASPLANFDYCTAGMDAARYPNVTAFKARILERPSFSVWIAKERKLLAR